MAAFLLAKRAATNLVPDLGSIRRAALQPLHVEETEARWLPFRQAADGWSGASVGRYSVRSLADHLNRHWIRPARGPDKANHNRPAAVIFTGDVIKDILKNPSYRGRVMLNGELTEGKHPPLIDEETWEAYVQVRERNRRRTSKTWTRHSYPLTPLLPCALCGELMRGKTLSPAGEHTSTTRAAMPSAAGRPSLPGSQAARPS